MTTNEGGICTPIIVSGKQFVKSSHIDTHTLLHVTDIYSTILDITGIQRPATVNGVKLAPLYGESFLTKLSNGSTTPRTLCFEMKECKAVIKNDWKAVQLTKPYGDGQTWKLYDIKNDLSEKQNLADKYPDLLKEMIKEWEDYAQSVGYIKSSEKKTVQRIGSVEFYKYDKKNILKEYTHLE